MADTPKKNIQQLDEDISKSKDSLNLSEGQILRQLARAHTPAKNTMKHQANDTFTPPTAGNSNPSIASTARTEPESSEKEDQQVVMYIKNMKKLQGSLEQKSYVLEVDYQKRKLNYESKIKALQNELDILGADLAQKEKEIKQKDNTIKVLNNQIAQLQSALEQKQATLEKVNTELAHYRKESVQAKEENKRYKADNKIIMNQIDKLTKATLTAEEKRRIYEDRESRIIQSLYQDSLPLIEERERRTDQKVNGLGNKAKLDATAQRNEELKSLIRRQNDQIDMLRAQKALLSEQNKQKYINLENQKQLVRLSEESNQKLNDLIKRMGDKILSLQQINQTLRACIAKTEEGQDYQDENYYQKSRAKAGQFYYKR